MSVVVVLALQSSTAGRTGPGFRQYDNPHMTKNIMPSIPGEYLSPGRYWLPSPETASDSTHEVQCTLPGFGAVRITYQRLSHRHGRMRSWFWTPIEARKASGTR